MSFSQDNFLGSFAGAGQTSAALAALSDAAYFKDGSKSMEGTMSLNSNLIISVTAMELVEGTGTLPATNQIAIYAKADKLLYQQDDAGLETLLGGGLMGPGSSTDNALARWDSTTGTMLLDSLVILSDTGAI